jgi:Zn-dependent peptidase ImmA (M78 family)
MAGMSLQDLSDKINNFVSKQALNKYEQGLMNPTSEVLLALSNALKIKPDYFLKKAYLEFGLISFRKTSSLLKKDEDSVIERVRYYIERFSEIESILNIDMQFNNPLADFLTDHKDVESAANKLRAFWDLGSTPIPNIIEMLELKGVRILLIDNVDQFDGLAVLTETGIPVVAVNIKNKSIERIRFTIIHELAHLLLSFAERIKNDNKMVEKLCHYFSSCFLIPSPMLIKMIGGNHRNYIAIKELIAIKEYYGISIRAIVHRLLESDVISQNYYQRWMIYMSKTYGQKDEPGIYIGQEKQKYFEQLINRALAEGLISFSKAASLLDVNIYDLRKGIENVG